MSSCLFRNEKCSLSRRPDWAFSCIHTLNNSFHFSFCQQLGRGQIASAGHSYCNADVSFAFWAAALAQWPPCEPPQMLCMPPRCDGAPAKKSAGLFSFVFFPPFGQSIVNGDLNKWHKTCFVSLLQSDDLSLCSHVTKWRPTETQWEFQLRLETLFKTLADPEIPQKLFLPFISGPFF